MMSMKRNISLLQGFLSLSVKTRNLNRMEKNIERDILSATIYIVYNFASIGETNNERLEGKNKKKKNYIKNYICNKRT